MLRQLLFAWVMVAVLTSPNAIGFAEDFYPESDPDSDVQSQTSNLGQRISELWRGRKRQENIEAADLFENRLNAAILLFSVFVCLFAAYIWHRLRRRKTYEITYSAWNPKRSSSRRYRKQDFDVNTLVLPAIASLVLFAVIVFAVVWRAARYVPPDLQ